MNIHVMSHVNVAQREKNNDFTVAYVSLRDHIVRHCDILNSSHV